MSSRVINPCHGPVPSPHACPRCPDHTGHANTFHKSLAGKDKPALSLTAIITFQSERSWFFSNPGSPLHAASPGACSEPVTPPTPTQIWGQVSLPVCNVHPPKPGRGSAGGERGAQTPRNRGSEHGGKRRTEFFWQMSSWGERKGRRRNLTSVPGKRNQLISGSGLGVTWKTARDGEGHRG